MGRRGCSETREVVMIARKEREREEVVGVLTNGVTWRRSYGDGHMMMLNRGGRWCFDGEMIPGVRMRDWSRGWCGG
jgi:hypothetical protein